MKIGFIGLGIMGESMCENIIKKHDDTVYVYDAVKQKTDLLAEKGGSPCEDALELAEKSDMIISMVPKSENSRSIYEAILPELDETKTCVDMSTIDPGVSRELAAMVKKKGARFADAPVVKSKPAAIAGTLGIYVGSDEETYEKILPVLAYMGSNIILMGGNGSGLVMKICHNALVSQIQNGVNETLTLAEANGISLSQFTEAVSYGGAQNFYLDSKKAVLEKGDFTPAFSVENMHKDVHICLRMAEEQNIEMPGEENAARVYDEAMKKGYGKEDFSATVKVVREQEKS